MNACTRILTPITRLCRIWWTSARPTSLGRSFATRVCGLSSVWWCGGFAKYHMQNGDAIHSLTLWDRVSQVSNYYTHMMDDNIPENLTAHQQHAVFDRAGEQIMSSLEDFGVPLDAFFHANVIFCSQHAEDPACLLTDGPPPNQNRGRERDVSSAWWTIT
jgi:hypothetical protein